MVKVNMLKGKIVEKGLTVEELAKEIGVNKSTLYRKFGDPDTFSVGEVNKIVTALDLTPDNAVAIFFDHDVA